MTTSKDYAKIVEAYVAYKEAEKNYKELAGVLVEDMQKRGVEKEVTPFGKFTITQRKSYVFGPSVTTLEEKVKLAKAKEINNGKAEVKLGAPSVRFTPPKLEE